MIRCEDVLKEISNYIDAEVTPELLRQIEEHLEACCDCIVLVNTTRKTLSLIFDNYILELPAGVSERLLERLAVYKS